MINPRYLELFSREDSASQIAEQILREGCVVLPEFFERSTADELLKYSRSLRGDSRFSITRTSNTPAMNVARSPEFMLVFDAVHKARCKILGTSYRPLDPTQQAVSLPLASANAVETPAPFHFDASFVNAVFAMQMPPGGYGNLLVYNNLRRRIRPLILSQVVARMLRHSSILRKVFPPREVNYKEGALHLFFGDLTLHGVPTFPQGERVTFTINASRIVKPPVD